MVDTILSVAHNGTTYIRKMRSYLMGSARDEVDLDKAFFAVGFEGFILCDTGFYIVIVLNAQLTFRLFGTLKDIHPVILSILIVKMLKQCFLLLWLTINNDTLHVYLADSIGHWKGNGIGNLRQHVIHVQPDVLASDSVSTFQVVHIMQDSILQDITDIGIKISELHQ